MVAVAAGVALTRQLRRVCVQSAAPALPPCHPYTYHLRHWRRRRRRQKQAGGYLRTWSGCSGGKRRHRSRLAAVWHSRHPTRSTTASVTSPRARNRSACLPRPAQWSSSAPGRRGASSGTADWRGSRGDETFSRHLRHGAPARRCTDSGLLSQAQSQVLVENVILRVVIVRRKGYV